VAAFVGSKFVAVGSVLRGLDGFVFVEGLLAIDELRGNLNPVEKASGRLEVNEALTTAALMRAIESWMEAESSGTGSCKGPNLRWGSAPTEWVLSW
jgi:hypothetical protein